MSSKKKSSLQDSLASLIGGAGSQNDLEALMRPAAEDQTNEEGTATVTAAEEAHEQVSEEGTATVTAAGEAHEQVNEEDTATVTAAEEAHEQVSEEGTATVTAAEEAHEQVNEEDTATVTAAEEAHEQVNEEDSETTSIAQESPFKALSSPTNILPDSPFFGLRASQKQILLYLFKYGDHITNYVQIEEKTGVIRRTASRFLNKLEREGYITKKNWAEGARRGIVITHLPALQSQQKKILEMITGQKERKKEKKQVTSISHMNNVPRTYEESQGLVSSSHTSSENALLKLTNEDISFFWPSLAKINFGSTQLSQIIQRLEQQGRDISTDLLTSLREGLNHADAALELSGGDLTDKEGKPILKPLNYIFTSLARHAYFAAPDGYISPELQRMQDTKKQAEIKAKIEAELEEALKNQGDLKQLAKYTEWKKGLSQDELNSIRAQAPSSAIRNENLFDTWLRSKYYPTLC